MSYHIYNYSYKNNSQNNKQPKNTHLFIETTNAIYFVDSSDPRVLLKSTDELVTISTVTTRAQKIQSAWYDRTNEELYFINGNNLGDGSADIEVWKLTLTTDTVTTYGDPLDTLGGAFTIGHGLDVFFYNNIPYCLVMYYWGNPFFSWFLLCGKYSGGVWQTVCMCDYTSNVNRYWKGVLDGNYFRWIDFGDVTGSDLLRAVRINLVAETYARTATAYGGYEVPTSENLRGISYDNISKIYYVVKKTADGLNYLHIIDIVADSYEEIGLYNVALMLDRNTLITNPIPFNMEKGFDTILDANNCMKVYQIGKGRSNLYAISQLQLGVGDSIVAVTDTYLVVNDSGTIQLWEYVDFISYLTGRSVIRAYQRKYWTCDLYIKETGALGDFLGFFDGCWVQIIGNLSSNTNTGLISYYNSPDNFLDQEVGDSGTDIAWVDSATLPNACTCTIIAELDNHKKVLKLTHDGAGSTPSIVHNMTATVATTYEWWGATSNVTRAQYVQFRTSTSVRINLYISASKYYYDAAGVPTEIVGATPTNNILAHFKIEFDCATDLFQLYINGTQRVTNGAFNSAATSIDNIRIMNFTNAAYSQYISAPSDVADDNYYEGQNTVKTKEDSVIFEGYLHFSNLRNPRKCWVDSPSLFDLKKKLTAGTYGAARTDENIVSILAVDSNYIVEGTMANGTAAVTTVIKGSKALQTQLNSYGQQDGFTYVIKPDQGQGLLNYNAGDVSSAVKCSQDEKIKNVEGKKQRAIINQVTVKGGIDTTTGIPYTGTANDTESQRLYGVQPITRTFANLYSDAACLAQATAILTIQQYVPYTYTFAKKIGWEGLVLPSETILLEYTPDSMIESGTRIINSLEFYFRRGSCKWNVEDAISYTTEMDLLKQEVEEISDLVEQIAATMFTLFTSKKLYYVSTDAELDAAITAIQAGNYSAKIILTADLTDVQANFNDPNIDVEIDGQGHSMESNGDNTILIFASVNKFKITNVVFNATDITTSTKMIVQITTLAKPSLIEFCEFYEATATKNGIGVYAGAGAPKVTVENCNFYYLYDAVYVDSINCKIRHNYIKDLKNCGIYIGAAAHDCSVIDNDIEDIDGNDAGACYGIVVKNGADRIRVENNAIDSIINSGAGTGYGILIEGANSDNCIVVGNGSHNCKTSNYTDSGTSTTAGNNDTT